MTDTHDETMYVGDGGRAPVWRQDRKRKCKGK